MIWSVGHSNHAFVRFAALLKGAGIEVVADVRTRPFSRFVPEYNQPSLKAALEAEGLGYVFMGETLGGKRAGSYGERVASASFLNGISALHDLAAGTRVAMMCAERHPLDCHRCRLIGRFLLAEGEGVRHILPDGEQVTQSVVQAQLLEAVGADLFSDTAEQLERAYAWKM